MLCVFFFFQAEDGIRDLTVTGVQTCALPISTGDIGAAEEVLDAVIKESREANLVKVTGLALHSRATVAHLRREFRSEERRVGKECRSRVWEGHEKKKKCIKMRV